MRIRRAGLAETRNLSSGYSISCLMWKHFLCDILSEDDGINQYGCGNKKAVSVGLVCLAKNMLFLRYGI